MTGSHSPAPARGTDAPAGPAAGRAARRPRVAYLSYSPGQFDARSPRMARSAIEAGWDVVIYARLEPGLPLEEQLDGFRLIRVPADWQLAVPILRILARRRAAAAVALARTIVPGDRPATAARAGDAADPEAEAPGPGDAAGDWPGDPTAAAPPRRRPLPVRAVRAPARVARRSGRQALKTLRRWRRLVVGFPLRPLGWATALESVAEPADVWHGMWAGSLAGVLRMRARHGGAAIYDSRDMYMQSRDLARLEWPLRPLLMAIERRWARAVDRVVTVNEPYADLLMKQLGVRRPVIIRNCPEAWTPPEPPPDLIRDALGLGRDVAVVLYQGQLITERGIEQSIEAILEVPDAALVLLGYGPLAEKAAALAARPPYRGKVFLLPAVPPGELIPWTASADVMVMAIQPTTINHRFTTPQKLFESIAAGVPVVASDLPGMAGIVNGEHVGVVCDPTSPASIAAAIRSLLEIPAEDRRRTRTSILALAHARYNWDEQRDTLFGLYRDLGASKAGPPPAEESAADAPPADAPAADASAGAGTPRRAS